MSAISKKIFNGENHYITSPYGRRKSLSLVDALKSLKIDSSFANRRIDWRNRCTHRRNHSRNREYAKNLKRNEMSVA